MELAAILKPAPFVKTEAGDPEQLLQDFWGGIVRRLDNSVVMGNNNVVMKPRCYRKPQRGNVSRSSSYVATRPVIGQNLHRGYTNHSFMVKI